MATDGAQDWQKLLDLANAGELSLDPEVGKNLDTQCQTYLDGLDDLRDMRLEVDHVTGFGAMPSGPILEQKFSLKAAGGGTSIEGSLQTHMEEVQLMRQVFAKAIANYHAVDEATGQKIAAIDVPGEGGS
ncbi:hypothetical protein [Nocardia suismassiliense]|uniref:hypothetical protein n=1 Tax=Nocardia suismassiliense TaxID=2077092 RepID=UPI00131F00F9|nr:hypothetical protein [Nocardia suismassiliense]